MQRPRYPTGEIAPQRQFKHFLIASAVAFLLQVSCTSHNQLIDITSLDPTIVVDLKYATANNFVGQKLYSSNRCYLRRSTAERLARVQQNLWKHGLGLKVWDGYRPLSVQWRMWELVQDTNYVADPRRGSRHNRGAAVDVTLVDSLGVELEMPTPFDDFSERAKRDYPALSKAALEHREILTKAMAAEGFVPLSSEWWHFDDPDWRKFPVLDIAVGNAMEGTLKQK